MICCCQWWYCCWLLLDYVTIPSPVTSSNRHKKGTDIDTNMSLKSTIRQRIAVQCHVTCTTHSLILITWLNPLYVTQFIAPRDSRPLVMNTHGLRPKPSPSQPYSNVIHINIWDSIHVTTFRYLLADSRDSHTEPQRRHSASEVASGCHHEHE
jgi:hypothetical protein